MENIEENAGGNVYALRRWREEDRSIRWQRYGLADRPYPIVGIARAKKRASAESFGLSASAREERKISSTAESVNLDARREGTGTAGTAG